MARKMGGEVRRECGKGGKSGSESRTVSVSKRMQLVREKGSSYRNEGFLLLFWLI